MDLNILLWIGGMLFSLGIFAIKVGLGMGGANYTVRRMCLVLFGYTVLFALIAISAEQLIRYAAPLLQRGPYTHTFLAAGLIVWGALVLLKKEKSDDGSGAAKPGHASLLMVVPCPVCISAMAFSTLAALNVVKMAPILLGLFLGGGFSVMALLVAMAVRNRTGSKSTVPLGMSMVVIGLYFIMALFLPSKIEAARGMYSSFAAETARAPSAPDASGVLLFILILLTAGFLAGRRKER